MQPNGKLYLNLLCNREKQRLFVVDVTKFSYILIFIFTTNLLHVAHPLCCFGFAGSQISKEKQTYLDGLYEPRPNALVQRDSTDS